LPRHHRTGVVDRRGPAFAVGLCAVGGDREDRPCQNAVERALVGEVGQNAADIGDRAAHAQDRHAAQADQDADPGAEAQRLVGDEGGEQGHKHRLGL